MSAKVEAIVEAKDGAKVEEKNGTKVKLFIMQTKRIW
jgi:hypothetical protein